MSIIALSLLACHAVSPPSSPSTARLSATPDVTFDGLNTSDQLGLAVAAAGDVNGDGYADVIAGAWGTGTTSGGAFVYEGSATGASPTPATSLYGSSKGDSLGRAVAGAGDVNGDV